MIERHATTKKKKKQKKNSQKKTNNKKKQKIPKTIDKACCEGCRKRRRETAKKALRVRMKKDKRFP